MPVILLDILVIFILITGAGILIVKTAMDTLKESYESYDSVVTDVSDVVGIIKNKNEIYISNNLKVNDIDVVNFKNQYDNINETGIYYKNPNTDGGYVIFESPIYIDGTKVGVLFGAVKKQFDIEKYYIGDNVVNEYVYVIDDYSVGIERMRNNAAMALDSVRDNRANSIGYFDDDMRQNAIREKEL